MDEPVVVVGAGPAGLATAACLRRRGVEPLVVDRGTAVGDSWRSRYDRLRLHTPRVQSSLPGMAIPRRYGRWVTRDDMADYLAEYAAAHGIVPRFGTEVRRIDRAGGTWQVTTGNGGLSARSVVMATGVNAEPVVPPWPGRETFCGELLHASAYTSPERFRSRSVLVVGTGNSGAEIAADLGQAGASAVHLSVRTPPNVVPRQLRPLPTSLLGISMDYAPPWVVDPVNRLLQRRFVGDLTRYGLPAPRAGLAAQARATGVIPVIDVGLVDALRAGKVTPVAAVAGFAGEEVLLADGSRLAPDVVIAATGYTPGLAPVVGHLGVLDPRGRPVVRGARTSPEASGLRFVGVSIPLKGLLLQIRLDARAAAAAIARELRDLGAGRPDVGKGSCWTRVGLGSPPEEFVRAHPPVRARPRTGAPRRNTGRERRGERGAGPVRRGVRLPTGLVRLAPQHADHRLVGDERPDRPRGRADAIHPAGRGRRHAAQPLAADHRRAVRHARGDVSGAHRPGPGPGAGLRPEHAVRAAPRPGGGRRLSPGRPRAAGLPGGGIPGSRGGRHPGQGIAGAAARPRLVAVRRTARRRPRAAVRLRLPLRPGRPAAGGGDLPRAVPALRAARPALRPRRGQRARRRHTSDDAARQLAAARRRLAVGLFARGRNLSDEEADLLLDQGAGVHVDRMLTHTAAGTAAEVRDSLTAFAELAEADELIVVHHAPTTEARLRSAALTAEAMAVRAA